jgi:hypothetical protein
LKTDSAASRSSSGPWWRSASRSGERSAFLWMASSWMPPPQREAREADQKADQERDAPAPGLQHLGRHRLGQYGAGRRPGQDAADRAAARRGADQAAPARLRMFDHEDDGGGVLAADRQALDHAQQREQDRRGDAQRLVAGQDADQEGRDGHRRHRESKRGAPSEAVADIADQRAADRPHQEANGEDAERRQHLRHLVFMGKEDAADGGGEVAVDREVVPFERVADRAGGDGSGRLAVGHSTGLVGADRRGDVGRERPRHLAAEPE